MNSYTRYIIKLWAYLRKLFKSGKDSLLVISKILLISFLTTFHMLSSAQTPRKDSGADGPMNQVLRGTVVSTVDHKPLDGVSVRVEAEKARTATKKDGTFSMNVEQRKGMVKFTYVGYKSQEMNYTSGVSLIVKLIPDDNKLEEVEVVSTGFQKIPKERATGSFEFVDNKLFNRKVSTDFVSRLEDVVPGITSRKVSNNRGDLLNVNVRGLSTLGSEGWPLVVIDGVPYDNKGADVGKGAFNNINPNDIENITVLKDAAASSIWGAQSGNGVIVITTKRGKFNDRTQLSFNFNASIKAKPNLYYHPQMKTSDYIDAQQYLFDKGKYDSWFGDKFYNPQPALWLMYNRNNGDLSEQDFKAEIAKMKNTDLRDDFLKHIYRNAVNQQYHTQLRSGGEKVSTLFSAGYDRNLNEVITSSFSRLNLKSNTQFKPIKNMVLDLGIMYTEIKNKESLLPVRYNGLAKGMQNGSFMIDTDKKTIRMVDATPLHGKPQDGIVVDWGDVRIMSLNENTMQLAVLRDPVLSQEGAAMLTYNFISKAYRESLESSE